MRLFFQINKLYLLFHSLNLRQPNPFPEWVNIKDKIWEESLPVSSFFMGRPESAFLETDEKEIKNTLNKFSKEAIPILEMVKNRKEFKRLISETEEYKKFVFNQWKTNRKKVIKTLEELTGSSLPEKTITVLITHPKLRNGIHFFGKNIIGWGHSEDWKNYTTVYLAHEIMHDVMVEKLGKEGRDDTSHAIIELMTDNELRIRLNKKGNYFMEKGQKVGHPYLHNTIEKILPIWKEYLKKKDKKIEEFYEKAAKI